MSRRHAPSHNRDRHVLDLRRNHRHSPLTMPNGTQGNREDQSAAAVEVAACPDWLPRSACGRGHRSTDARRRCAHRNAHCHNGIPTGHSRVRGAGCADARRSELSDYVRQAPRDRSRRRSRPGPGPECVPPYVPPGRSSRRRAEHAAACPHGTPMPIRPARSGIVWWTSASSAQLSESESHTRSERSDVLNSRNTIRQRQPRTSASPCPTTPPSRCVSPPSPARRRRPRCDSSPAEPSTHPAANPPAESDPDAVLAGVGSPSVQPLREFCRSLRNARRYLPPQPEVSVPEVGVRPVVET